MRTRRHLRIESARLVATAAAAATRAVEDGLQRSVDCPAGRRRHVGPPVFSAGVIDGRRSRDRLGRQDAVSDCRPLQAALRRQGGDVVRAQRGIAGRVVVVTGLEEEGALRRWSMAESSERVIVIVVDGCVDVDYDGGGSRCEAHLDGMRRRRRDGEEADRRVELDGVSWWRCSGIGRQRTADSQCRCCRGHGNQVGDDRQAALAVRLRSAQVSEQQQQQPSVD